MSRICRIPFLAAMALLLLAAPPVPAQRDLSADSPLAGESPLVELLLAQDWTREEMAQRLLRALEVAAFQPEDCVPGEEMFSDLPASSPFCSWVEELARRGITGGCGDGVYCPTAPVSRQQMAVFLIRAIEAAVDEAAQVPAGGDLTGNYPDPLIAPLAVTTEKLADDAVTGDKVADNAITSVKIVNGQVRAPDLGPINQRSAAVVIAPASSDVAIAACQSNEVALSGGGVFDGATAANKGIQASFPSGNAWVAVGRNNTGVNQTFRAYVLCLQP